MRQNISFPISHFKCILILVKRRLHRFREDKADMAWSFAQAPFLAVSFFIVFQKIITFSNTGLSHPLRTYLTGDTRSIILFLTVLVAIWFGSFKAISEIPQTRILYKQENLSFLNNFDYLISNFIALSLIIMVQMFLFSLTFHLLFVTIPAYLNPFETGIILVQNGDADSILDYLMLGLFFQFLGLMCLISIASIAGAMLLSTFIKNPSTANTLLSFLLIIQILLGGSIIKPVKDMNLVVGSIANFMISRWGFEAIVLTFEDKLILSLLGKKDSSFTTSLKSTNPKLYLDQSKSEWKANLKYPRIVGIDDEIADAWLQTIYYEKNSLKNLGEEYSTRIDNYFSVDESKKNTKIISALLEAKLNNEALKDIGIYFYDSSSTGIYRKLVVDALTSSKLTPTKTEKIILEDAMGIDGTLRFFRFQNQLNTWLALTLITLLALLLSWFVLSVKNKQIP